MKQTDTLVHFRINSPQVLHEAFDDETVIINLESGAYFTLDSVARKIWDLLAAGGNADMAVADVCARYQGDKAEIGKSVYAFIDQLRAEGLIVPMPAGEEPTSAVAAVGAADDRPLFSRPEMQKYTDMQELLLLDPIHEVDDQGWPIAKKDQ